mgnify:CR=1 FL=1
MHANLIKQYVKKTNYSKICNISQANIKLI